MNPRRTERSGQLENELVVLSQMWISLSNDDRQSDVIASEARALSSKNKRVNLRLVATVDCFFQAFLSVLDFTCDWKSYDSKSEL